MPGFVVDGSDSFISKLAGGGARASLFNANLIFKSNLAENSKTGVMDNKTFGFMCKGVQIPIIFGSQVTGATRPLFEGETFSLQIFNCDRREFFSSVCIFGFVCLCVCVCVTLCV